MTIKAIIFDLGGVIININYSLTSAAFKKLGAHDFDKVYSQFKQSPLFDNYETGKIESDVFRKELTELLDLSITDEQFDKAWNAMLLDLPQERLDFIKQLRQNYQTFLYSNTNAIHLKKVSELADFNGCFVKEYYSHQFGMRKPHKESFEKLLRENGLNASETLFIDDTPQHIEGARQAGLHTMLIDKNNSIFDLPAIIQQINKEEENHNVVSSESQESGLIFSM